jgi:excisionase family DNA binding protein
VTGFPAGPGIDVSGVLTPPARCGALLRALGETVRLAHGAPGQPDVPPLLAAFLAQLRCTADRLSAAAAADVQVSQGRGNGECPGPGGGPSSERKPEGLTTSRAAEIAGISARTMRNLITRGQVTAWRVRGGAYRVELGSLAEWLSADRKERDSGAE